MHTSLSHQEAEHRVFLGFYIHLAVFVLVNGALAFLNYSRNPERLWFLWVVGGWGIGVALHALLTYLPETRERAVHRMAERIERRQARRAHREERRESRLM